MEDDLDIFENGRRLSKKFTKSKTVYKEYEKKVKQWLWHCSW